MIIINFFILLIGLVIALKHNNFGNPLVCFILPQCVSHFLCSLIYSDVHLGDITILSAMLGNIGFLLGYFIISIAIPIRKNSSFECNYYFNRKLDIFYKIIGFIALILGGYVAVKRALNNDGSNIFFAIRAYASINKYGIPFVDHFMVLLQITFYIYIYRFFVQNEKTLKNEVIFLTLCMLLKFFYSLSKTDVLSIVSYSLYIYYISVKKYFKLEKFIKLLTKFFVAFLFLIFLATGLRHNFYILANQLGSKDFFLYKYLSYPLASFEMNVSRLKPMGNGYNCLEGFGKVLGKLGFFTEDNMNHKDEMDEDSLSYFNVFGYVGRIYLDFGLNGCFVVPILIGGVCGFLFKLSEKKKGLFTIFYAVYINSIIIAFFDYQFLNGIFFWVFLGLIPPFLLSKKYYAESNLLC